MSLRAAAPGRASLPRGARAGAEALAVGVATGLAFAPSPWSWAATLGIAVLFARVAAAPSPRAAFWVGTAGGLGFFAAHLAWLPVSFAELFGLAGAAPMPLAALVLALMWGAAAAGARWLGERRPRPAWAWRWRATGSRAATLAVLPLAWVALEFLRGLGTLGFTWGTLGYALVPTPMIQVADLGGVGLASLLVAGTAAALASAASGSWRPLVPAALALALAGGYGLTRPEPGAADREALVVQGSVSALEKARGRSASELELYADLTGRGLAAGPRPDLIVWPEGAVPWAPTEPAVAERLRDLPAPAIVGAPTRERGEYRNSAYGVVGGLVTGRYDKVKLVPFGETFPLRQELGFVYDAIFGAMGLPGLVGATPGKAFAPLDLGSIRAGTYICYESTFPAVTRALVLGGAGVLVNISNDAWFGRTAGAEQHFQMGRVRAIETRRYIVRAGNDGISAVIDPLGRVVQRFPRGERSAYRARFGVADGLTAYARLGDWPAALAAVGLVLAAAVRVRHS